MRFSPSDPLCLPPFATVSVVLAVAAEILPDGPASTLSGVARVLVLAGKLPSRIAEDLSRVARDQRRSFVSAVVSANALSAYDLACSLSQVLGLPLLDLDAIDINRLPQNLVDARTLSQYQVLVLGRRGSRLFIGGADPTDQEAVDRIKFATQLTPEWVVLEYDKLARIVDAKSTSAGDALDSIVSSGDFDFEVEEQDASTKADDEVASAEVEDAPVVRFLQKMLVDAINMRASDLHFEPYENTYRVRFRIDGELREITQPPIAIKDKLSSRIKVISKLDISEKRVPQDGRMKLKFGSKAIDFRVSTLPTLFGEKIVIRILDPSSARLGVDALGYERDEKERLLSAVRRPYGMILVTGPTGSGKTVSLYTCLNILNQPGVNISTVEDPAEINLPGVNQVNVNDKAGMNFAVALKAFLRQDPDVIMVGEIRDLETAEIAVKAAQTGHMVLSTLHTNDAPQTIARLMNMGIAPYNITSSVTLVIAQRLARRLHDCKRAVHLPEPALRAEGFSEEEIKEGISIYEAVGCNDCNDGYKGRVGIYQVMPMTDEIQKIILEGGNALQIAEAAIRSGVKDLRQSALLKAKNGVTSLAEINRVTKD